MHGYGNHYIAKTFKLKLPSLLNTLLISYICSAKTQHIIAKI